MEIIEYDNKYRQQVIDLILHIQNDEAGIGLTLEEQPDISDVPQYYLKNGGTFFLATENGAVIGTVGSMNYGNGNAVMKKFFVRNDMRERGVGSELYNALLSFWRREGFKRALLDTPSVAKASHRFYERAGFRRIAPEEMPFYYEYPDRDSYLYLLNEI